MRGWMSINHQIVIYKEVYLQNVYKVIEGFKKLDSAVKKLEMIAFILLCVNILGLSCIMYSWIAFSLIMESFSLPLTSYNSLQIGFEKCSLPKNQTS